MSLSLGLGVLAAAVSVRAYVNPTAYGSHVVAERAVPELSMVIDQKALNVLPTVPPPSEANASTLFIPPGADEETYKSKPFHVYDEAFYDIIGPNPTLTLIANSGTDPLFHEAVVWYPPTDEVFFVQNAGSKAAGTGLKKSAIVQKISVAEAAAVSHERNATGRVKVETVHADPPVINPNGGTIFQGQIAFAGEGQGDNVAPELRLMNPRAPYNTTAIVNNYHGRQFNSLNDLYVNPRNNDLYFTDTFYGFYQDFRPALGLPQQIYRYHAKTGAVTVVADQLVSPNGLTFSPDGRYAYVCDTGSGRGFLDADPTLPSTIYRYNVEEDGTFSGRKTFAYVASGIPDGVHCDSKGNVYAGCGDGVHVFDTAGLLLGKIYLGETSANFNFAGDGRLVICAETNLYFATIAATGGTYIS